MSLEFKLQLDMGNAAFDEGMEGHETARILRELADKIDHDLHGLTRSDTGTLRDINGNKVGTWEVVEPKPVYLWMEFGGSDTVCVWEVKHDNSMKTVVLHAKRGYRDAKQAVREELVNLGLMKAPDHAPSGGKKWHDDVELIQL
jgi:hypothetical protein